MGEDRSESGTLTLKKPGRMRWAYDTPRGKLFLLDGTSAIFYTPGDPQAQRLPAKQLDDLRSPLRFLLGHTELAKELDHLTLTVVNGGYTLSGVPKGMQQRLHALALTVDTSGQIHSLRLEEIDGATTTFTFTDLHENVPTRDSDFIFSARPPRGGDRDRCSADLGMRSSRSVEVLRSHQPGFVFGVYALHSTHSSLSPAPLVVYRYSMRLRLLAVAFLTLPLTLAAQTPQLIPVPREYHAQSDRPLPHGVQIICTGCDADDQFAATDLRQHRSPNAAFRPTTPPVSPSISSARRA